MKYKTAAMLLLPALAIGGCVTTQQPSAANNLIPSMKDPNEPRADTPIAANTRLAAGQLAEARGDLPQAIIQYEACLKLDPKSQTALMHLAVIYCSQQRFDQSIALWNRYVQATGNSASAYCNLGLTLEMAKKPREAETAYKQAVARDGHLEPARVNYGLMLARQDRLDEALTQLQAVLTPAEAQYDVASVLETEGKTDAAKTHYEEAIRLDPKMSDARSRLSALDTGLE